VCFGRTKQKFSERPKSSKELGDKFD
jgi:hypothetical protein